MRAALLFLACASPALLRAQFQAPTQDELKMTADPKAPGAAAVILNYEEIDNDPKQLQSYYARIKVLSEKGKELATVEIPYWHAEYKISEIQARTIHSDGTVIPLTGKPEDLLKFKEKTKSGNAQANTKVFTLPSVEVGSILEYRFNVITPERSVMEPEWDIQRPYFVHKAHYAFTPFVSFMNRDQGESLMHRVVNRRGEVLTTLVSWPILPAGMQLKTEAASRYTLDATDVPPIPEEGWMPPVKNLAYKVVFYYIRSTTVDDFWSEEIKYWSKEVDRFAEPTRPIHEAVDGLIAPGDADLDKARKLYKAVQPLDNTDFSRKKSEAELKQLKLKEAKRAEDVWAQRSGSSEDIALLYLAMVRAAGLTANAMKVVDREKGIFDPAYLYAGQLNDTIVVLNIGGKEIDLDPGEKMCPFQTLHWRHASASGFLQGDNTINNKPSQALLHTDNKTSRKGDLTVDELGNAQGTLRLEMTGQEALKWRQIALQNDPDEVKKQFDQWLETTVPQGVDARVDRFLGLDDPDVNLVALVNAKGPLGTATARRVLLPGFFFEARNNQPFVDQEKRQEPVDMHFGEMVSDQVVYRLPAGFAVEGAPQDAKIAWAGHAVFIVKTVSSPGQIVVARMLARAFTFASPGEYQDLRGFYQKVAAAGQQQLVLTRAPAAKGN
jgi:hypothetical protein